MLVRSWFIRRCSFTSTRSTSCVLFGFEEPPSLLDTRLKARISTLTAAQRSVSAAGMSSSVSKSSYSTRISFTFPMYSSGIYRRLAGVTGTFWQRTYRDAGRMSSRTAGALARGGLVADGAFEYVQRTASAARAEEADRRGAGSLGDGGARGRGDGETLAWRHREGCVVVVGGLRCGCEYGMWE
jgi:hypothetical protein